MTQALYILAEMSDKDLDWLITSGRQSKVSADTILIEEGGRTDALYIVLEGTFTVEVNTLSGRIEIARLTLGDIIGEMSFLDSRPASATVKSVEDSLVWSIPWTKLSSKLLIDTGFASGFYHALALSLSDRMRRLLDHISISKWQQIHTEVQMDISPSVLERIDLVNARFQLLLQRMKEMKY